MRKFISLLVGLCWLIPGLLAKAPVDLWQKVSPSTIESLDRRVIRPVVYQPYQLDFDGIKSVLDQAPFERNISNQTLSITLPDPTGAKVQFEIMETDVMPAVLAAKFPQIKTFLGYQKDNPARKIRLDYTAQGFHAKVFGLEESWYIDPASMTTTQYYMIYRKGAVEAVSFGSGRLCGTPEPTELEEDFLKGNFSNNTGAELLTYEVAVTGDERFTNFHGGKTQALSAIVTIVNRITGIYENELAIRVGLIPNNDLLVFDSTDDPYTANDNPNPNTFVSQMAQATPAILNTLIGTANYDFGHVFTLGFGFGVIGTAGGIGTVCGPASLKGGACTSDPTPIGPGFEQTLAHEFGHQFNATHTFNINTANCAGARTNISAYEPGDAATIMGYEGCSGGSISDGDYFHVNSYQRIFSYMRLSTGNNCAVKTPTGNTPPVVDPGMGGYTIPVSTPFVLEGSATDIDGDNLTYCWEQYDLGPAGLPTTPTGNAPIFRSFTPTNTGTRTFPRISDVVTGNATLGEILPSYGRNMRFRLSVRDNNIAGGGYSYEEITLAVSDQAGPFIVTFPNSSVGAISGGDPMKVQWDVANTNVAPVNCQKVNILLSEDGGATYPYTLAEDVPNNGQAVVCLPDLAGTNFRMRVEAEDNIFFDISDQNFTINATTQPGFTFATGVDVVNVCQDGTSNLEFLSCAQQQLTDKFKVRALGAPAGVTISTIPDSITPGEPFTVLVNAEPTVPVGTYTFSLFANSGTASYASQVNVAVGQGVTQPALGLYPINQNRVGSFPSFNWGLISGVSEYNIEVASSPTFGSSIVFFQDNIQGTSTNVNAALQPNTTYYWRVSGASSCGGGVFSETYAFRTGECQVFENNTPVSIPAFGSPALASSIIEVPQGGAVSDVNVLLTGTHSRISEIQASITSPSGLERILFNQVCNDGSQDFDIGFDDDAISSTIECPPVGGVFYEPLIPLNGFNGQPSIGNWELKLRDNTNLNGGELIRWNLEVCSERVTNLSLIKNVPLAVELGNTRSIYDGVLEATNPNLTSADITFTLVTLPTEGTLRLNGNIMNVGDTFTQEDIEGNQFRYTQTGSGAASDAFDFVVEDTEGGWVGISTFQINVVPTANDELLDAGIQIRPNPAQEVFTLVIEDLTLAEGVLSLYNVNGQLVRQVTVSGTQTQVAIEDLQEGMYLVQFQSGDKLWTSKLLKQ
ncbi:MAG: reprolysin-like metallopeptidase [Bacteroidota bacterium]